MHLAKIKVDRLMARNFPTCQYVKHDPAYNNEEDVKTASTSSPRG